jgi:hypothetical protein
LTETDQLQQDLHFVRRAVARRQSEPTPQIIPIVWGVFVLVSFAMLDFYRTGAAWMFTAVAPALALFSGWIGRAQARRAGETDRRAGRIHALHWGSIFLAMMSLVVLAATGRVRGEGVGQVATLLVGLVYFLAGVHLDGRWMISGLLLMAGAAAVAFVPRYPWTILGAVVCLALVLPAFLPRRADAHHE